MIVETVQLQLRPSILATMKHRYSPMFLLMKRSIAETTIPAPVNVTATDNCDSDPTITLDETTLPGSCAGSFILIRTWTATDDCGNSTTAVQTINIGDNEAPVFTNIPADETINCGTTFPAPCMSLRRIIATAIRQLLWMRQRFRAPVPVLSS